MCSADTALETGGSGSTVQSDLKKDYMLRTPQVYHTALGMMVGHFSTLLATEAVLGRWGQR